MLALFAKYAVLLPQPFKDSSNTYVTSLSIVIVCEIEYIKHNSVSLCTVYLSVCFNSSETA